MKFKLYFVFALLFSTLLANAQDSVVNYNVTNIRNATQYNPITPAKHWQMNKLMYEEYRKKDSITRIALRDTSVALRSSYDTILNHVKTNFWNENGNVVSGGANKLGSTNNAAISFITNNVERAKIEANGTFSIDGIPFGQNGQNLHNIFTGANAGLFNTTGFYNNFTGVNAGYSNTTGSSNNFTGVNAGLFNATGSSNNFTGVNAGHFNTTGSYNNFTGANAGLFNATGSSNNFTGANAGYFNTTGSSNNFIGANAGYFNTTGSSNNFIGANAGYSNTIGNGNVVIGSYLGTPTMNDEIVLATGTTKRFHSVGDLSCFGSNVTTPHSTIQSGGSFATAITTTTSNIALGSSHSVVVCDGSIIVTLPSAIGIQGRQYIIKRVSGVPIANTSLSQTIDNQASYTLNNSYECITVVSDGANWYIISKF